MKLRLSIYLGLLGAILCLAFSASTAKAVSYEISDGSIKNNYLFGNNLSDSSGNGNTGTYYGDATATFSNSVVPGDNFQYSWDASYSTKDMFTAPVAATTTIYTIGWHMKLKTTGGTNSIIAFPMLNEQEDPTYLYYTGGKVTLYYDGGNYIEYSWTQDTNWHFWTWTRDNDHAYLYLDGTKVATSTNVPAYNAVNDHYFTINNYSGDIGSGNYYVADAYFADFFMSEDEMTSSTIAAIWNGGDSKPICTVPDCGNAIETSVEILSPLGTYEAPAIATSTGLKYTLRYSSDKPVRFYEDIKLWTSSSSYITYTDQFLGGTSATGTNLDFDGYIYLQAGKLFSLTVWMTKEGSTEEWNTEPQYIQVIPNAGSGIGEAGQNPNYGYGSSTVADVWYNHRIKGTIFETYGNASGSDVWDQMGYMVDVFTKPINDAFSNWGLLNLASSSQMANEAADGVLAFIAKIFLITDVLLSPFVTGSPIAMLLTVINTVIILSFIFFVVRKVTGH